MISLKSLLLSYTVSFVFRASVHTCCLDLTWSFFLLLAIRHSYIASRIHICVLYFITTCDVHLFVWLVHTYYYHHDFDDHCNHHCLLKHSNCSSNHLVISGLEYIS